MVTTSKEEALFFQYLDFLPAPALIGREGEHNTRGKTLFVNKAFIDAIGYQLDEIPDYLSFISKAYPDPSYRREVAKIWADERQKSQNSPIKFSSKMLCKDKQYRWFDIQTELKSSVGEGLVIVLFNNIDKAKNEALEYAELSRTDPLTKLANRRYMEQLLHEEKTRREHDRNNLSFSVVMADIDSFKAINDTYGHMCGDYVIQTVSNIIQNSTRKIDVASRWGGEEYLLLLPKTNVTEARIVVKKITKRIHEYPFEWDGQRFSVSLTYGITEHHDSENTQLTIQRADECLYQGKNMGRDCIVTDDLYESWRA